MAILIRAMAMEIAALTVWEPGIEIDMRKPE
jgi:hypothetical protein